MKGQSSRVRAMPCWRVTLVGILFASAPLTANGIQPRPVSEELQTLPSIDCLEARLKDPNANCDDIIPQDGRTVRVIFNMSQVAPRSASHNQSASSEESVIVRFSMNETNGQETSVRDISLFNFPNYKAPACRNNNAPVCDPYGFLSVTEGKNLSLELEKLRAQHLVICEDLISEPIDQRHLQPFYVGVAIAQANGAELSLSTLRQYGHLILSEWNMDEAYAANGQLMRCPNQALLLIVPDRSQVVLVTDSCRYVCEEKGAAASQVVTSSLHRGSVADAVLAGVRSVYDSLPLSVPQGEAMPPLAVEAPASPESNAETWVLFVQRAVFAFAVMALGFSLLVGLLVMCFAPGLAKGHRGYISRHEALN
ncbi:unnamed protein product [Symbiodinium pilosum]|uniref:Uncharacterized protein n=1 Tax=Symbiodinium pilosum TaxID=2952 RepID=A0A812QKM7_SYMPI|nr:unnamed protein product [Symbiodinium pilosum]